MWSTEQLVDITQHPAPRLIAVSLSSLETTIRNSNIYFENCFLVSFLNFKGKTERMVVLSCHQVYCLNVKILKHW